MKNTQKRFSDVKKTPYFMIGDIKVTSAEFKEGDYVISFELFYKTYNVREIRFVNAKVENPVNITGDNLYIDSYEVTEHKGKTEMRIVFYRNDEEIESFIRCEDILVDYFRYPIESGSEVILKETDGNEILFERDGIEFKYEFSDMKVLYWQKSSRVPNSENAKVLKDGDISSLLPPLPIKAIFEPYYTEKGFCFIFRRVFSPELLKSEKEGYVNTFAIECENKPLINAE